MISQPWLLRNDGWLFVCLFCLQQWISLNKDAYIFSILLDANISIPEIFVAFYEVIFGLDWWLNFQLFIIESRDISGKAVAEQGNNNIILREKILFMMYKVNKRPWIAFLRITG